MAPKYPSALVTTSDIPDVNALATLSADNHKSKHDQTRDEVIAIETKMGITGTADNTTFEFRLNEITGGDKAVGKSAVQTLLNKILGTATKILLGSDATGDMYYNSGAGLLARFGIGTAGQAVLSDGTKPFWGSLSGANIAYIPDTGAANAYVATLSPALGAYVAGSTVEIKIANANTGASTINVNGLGVVAIKNPDGSALLGGALKVGTYAVLKYDGTNFQLVSTVANPAVLKFGGTGADGALTITSGVTTIDLAGAQYVTKNYTSISITGTASVAFINPHANGTIIVFKSQGAVTLTSSTVPLIDTRGMGGNTSTDGTNMFIRNVAGGLGSVQWSPIHNSSSFITTKMIPVACGSGGATGSAVSGVAGSGGRGGGGLYIECGGALNFTGTINTSGNNGQNGQSGESGGGGGGSAGLCVILYNSLTANSGTITAIGGTGGTAIGSSTGGASGGAGAGGMGGVGGTGTTGLGGNAGGVGAGSGGGGTAGGNRVGGTAGASTSGFVILNTEIA